jgi:hypothetical protein
MMFMGFSGLGYAGLGDINTPCASLSPASMSIGDSCTLPDDSNIGVWNGTRLVNPSGSSIDAINASALIAGGNWTSAQVGGGSGTNNSADGQPWWSTALRSLVQGAAAGITTPTPGGMPPCNTVAAGTPCTPVPTATPWYQTPVGMVGIVLGVLGVGYLFLKR